MVNAGAVLGSTGTNQLVITAGSASYTFNTTSTETVGQLIANINSSGDGLQASINSATGPFTLTDTYGNGNLAVNTANSDSTVVTALFGVPRPPTSLIRRCQRRTGFRCS